MVTEPPDLSCREDVLVEDGAAAPKSCLPSLEMCSPTAEGGLLPTGETSTATKITFNEPPLRFYSTVEPNPKETQLWASLPSACDDSSFRRNKLLAAPSCKRVIETKSGQNRTFDLGGSQGRLHACPFWDRGARCFVWRSILGLDETAVFFGGSMIQDSNAFRRAVRAKLRRAYSGQFAGSLKLGRL